MKRKYNGTITKWLFLLTTLFTLIAPCAVSADSSVDAKIQNLEIGKDQFTLYIDQKQGEIFYPTVRDSSASLGKQNCRIMDIKNLKDAKLGVAYDCIVDVSGSMDKARIEDVKVMLTQLNHEKKSQDLMRITQMANERNSTAFLKDIDEIDSIIETIEVTHEDTNLYESLKKESEELVADTNLPRRRCILIFSDGCEDQKKGITKDEAFKTVKSNDIPVFTVALLPKKAKDEDIEAAKLLGSFGRSSYGGAHYAPAVDGSVYEEIVNEIIGIANDSLTVTVDLSDLKLRRNKVDLNLSLAAGGFVADIVYEIDQDTAIQMLLSGEDEYVAADDKEEVNVETKAADATEESEEEIQDNSKTADENTGMNEIMDEIKDKIEDSPMVDGDGMVNEAKLERLKLTKIILVIVCAVILIAAVVIVIVLAARGGKGQASGAAKYIDVTLTRVKDQKAVTKRAKSSLAFGRDGKCDYSFPDDNALSDFHCYFIYEAGRLFVQDNNSTNGVFVNGVPQFGKCALSNGDMVLIGSYEYKVSWA